MFDFKGLIGALLRRPEKDPVANLKSATIWVQELSRDDIQEAQEEIIKALVSLNENKKTTLKERIQILTYLDEKAISLQESLCRDYLTHFETQDATEKLYLPTILSFWEEMAESYQLCVREFAQNPSGKKIWDKLPILTARALHYYAMQVKWSYMRYFPAENQIWRNLGRLYLFAEREGFVQNTLRLYPHYHHDTTCQAEYLQPLLLQLASPESLLPAQINLIDHWLDSCGRSVTLETEFRPHRQLYAVNLGDGKPGRKLRRNMLGEKYRYWGVGMLLVTISKTVEQLKEGEMPARLGLGEECRLPACLDLIELITSRWAGKGRTRVHERKVNVDSVEVLQGLKEILLHLNPARRVEQVSKPSRESTDIATAVMDFKRSALDEENLESEPLTGAPDLFQTSPREWIMENESLSGFGAAFEAGSKIRLKVGTLVGLRPESHKHFAIGVVRRINKDLSSRVHVGILTLTQTPILVELNFSENAAKNKFMEAVYLPESSHSGLARSILMSTSAYVNGQIMQLVAQGKSYSIRLHQPLEQTAEYTRVNFEVLAKL